MGAISSISGPAWLDIDDWVVQRAIARPCCLSELLEPPGAAPAGGLSSSLLQVLSDDAVPRSVGAGMESAAAWASAAASTPRGLQVPQKSTEQLWQSQRHACVVGINLQPSHLHFIPGLWKSLQTIPELHSGHAYDGSELLGSPGLAPAGVLPLLPRSCCRCLWHVRQSHFSRDMFFLCRKALRGEVNGSSHE